jgi:hypothetical protein
MYPEFEEIGGAILAEAMVYFGGGGEVGRWVEWVFGEYVEVVGWGGAVEGVELGCVVF